LFPKITDKYIALDIETYDPDLRDLGPGPRRDGTYILGVGIATESKEYYFPLGHRGTENVDKKEFFAWLGNLGCEVITANGLYDFDFLQYEDYRLPKIIHDVQFAEALIDENLPHYTLASLGRYLPGNSGKDESEIEQYAKDRKWKGKPQEHLYKMPANLVGKYCKIDCRTTYDVFMCQLPILEKQSLMPVYQLEISLIPVLLRMRRIGVRVDISKLSKLKKQYKSKISELQKQLNTMCGFELNTNAAKSIQIAFDKFGYKYYHTDKGNPTFTSKFLESCNNKLAVIIVEMRHLQKIYNTYLEGMERFLIRGRLHTEFHPLRTGLYGTISGRFSSSRPNLQNIPARDEQYKKDIRGLFLPEENQKWVKLDYSQEEMVIFAHYAEGPKSDELRDMYTKTDNADMYKIIASVALGKPVDEITKNERTVYKSITLGLLYGMGTDKLGRQLGIIIEPSPEYGIVKKHNDNLYNKREEFDGIDEQYYVYFDQYNQAKKILEDVHTKFPCLRQTTKHCQRVAEERGYVRTILRRRRRFPDRKLSYKAFNSVDQGSAGDIIKVALWRAYNDGIFDVLTPHLTVHDEIDVSLPDTEEGRSALKRLREIMETAVELKVPLTVDMEIGDNWSDIKNFDV